MVWPPCGHFPELETQSWPEDEYGSHISSQGKHAPGGSGEVEVNGMEMCMVQTQNQSGHEQLAFSRVAHLVLKKGSYILRKVFKSEFIGLGEKLESMHSSNIQDNVCPLFHPVAINDIVL